MMLCLNCKETSLKCTKSSFVRTVCAVNARQCTFTKKLKKMLFKPGNLCDDSGEFNKCKGGDLVSRKILERGFGTAWEVAR